MRHREHQHIRERQTKTLARSYNRKMREIIEKTRNSEFLSGLTQPLIFGYGPKTMSILKVTAEEFHRKLVTLIFDKMQSGEWDNSEPLDADIEAFIKENVELECWEAQ